MTEKVRRFATVEPTARRVIVEVRLDGKVIGTVAPSDRRWARGWSMTTADGKDLGDQPRKTDAIATLTAYATSPFRKAKR